jgi:hypothetical protein
MKANDLYPIAAHEAGHAVIGRVMGMRCGKATIVADHDSAGHAITKDPWAILEQWEKQEKFRRMDSVFIGRILTYMAGREAQIELAGTPDVKSYEILGTRRRFRRGLMSASIFLPDRRLCSNSALATRSILCRCLFTRRCAAGKISKQRGNAFEGIKAVLAWMAWGFRLLGSPRTVRPLNNRRRSSSLPTSPSKTEG